MQVDKSNKNIITQVMVAVIAAEMAGGHQSNHMTVEVHSTSQTLLIRWLAQASHLHRRKDYNLVQTNSHASSRG
jgi:hypothetical protein